MINIRYLIMDVDGTLTDGKIYMGETGELLKAFSIKDGYGISHLLPLYNITPVILTGRESKILTKRCIELGINNVYQGVVDKRKKLLEIFNSRALFSNIAYIGDDLNDIDSMLEVKTGGGIVGCPKDSTNEIIKIADFVSEFYGGNGAVRDFIDYIINKTEV